MTAARDIAEQSAHICGAALVMAGASSIAPMLAPLTVLALVGRGYLSGKRAKCTETAITDSLKALTASHDFTADDLDRARTLLADTSRKITLDPTKLHEARHGATFDADLARHLLRALPFQPDDAAPKEAIRIAFTTCIARLRSRPEVQQDIDRSVLFRIADDAGLTLVLLDSIKADTASLRASADRIEADVLTHRYDTLNLTDEVRALVTASADKARELQLTEQLFIGLARRIARDVDNIDDAHRELEAAVTRAADMARQAQLPSNLGAQVDAVLAEVARLNAADELEAATRLIEAELAEADAHKSRLLTLAIDQALLSRAPETAASHLIARADLEAGGRAEFGDLHKLWIEWYENGRDKGLNLDLEVSIALARLIHARAADADERGAALNDLGISLGERGTRDATPDRLTESVAAYRAALTEFTQDRVPLDWAMTQNNLGSALLRLGERSGDTDLMIEAAAAYRAALAEWTPNHMPLDWATAQNNLGAALSSLGGRCGDTGVLTEAVVACRAALTERTRDRAPLGWAATQNNLGSALLRLGECSTDTKAFDAAVAAYRAALTEYTQDRVPLDWATTQSNLGIALQALGERSGDTGVLTEAVAACRAALKERTRDRVPLDWAATQSHLGIALTTLGQRSGDTEMLDRAAAAILAALTEFTRDRVPLDWAGTQNNLAGVWIARFDLTCEARHLDTAQEHLDRAVEVYTEAGAEGHIALARDEQAKIDARRT